jgi:hypothetical protein
MAAQDGTAAGIADGLGFADGLWSGVGDGMSEALDEGLAVEGVGLWCEATPPELEQPATASMATKTASLIPTERRNAARRGDVTGGIEVTRSQ